MLKKHFQILLMLIPLCGFAQAFETEFETNFAWEVKQVDEFIERFNDADHTLIKDYNKKFTKSPLTREALIKSLFDSKRSDWNYEEVMTFITQVTNEEDPEYLDFNNENWYAKVSCNLKWKGKLQKAVLKLNIRNLANGGCKWVLTDIEADFLKLKNPDGTKVVVVQPQIATPTDFRKFLNPISHTNDFLEIDKISEDAADLGYYVDKSEKYSDSMCLFIAECRQNNIKILHANSIVYTFSQIKGWQIEIRQFNRQSRNSGWLISKLIKTPI
ncbi:hypothetical protein [Flavobacterium wongokense]|uniref:hypothetical protein n=1 Tax=Flavobacterium wongokense TaxID=2910674 RepID=UPI001F47F0D5|nr:hypothetical protein [Flavobacterium sp. WG47]MCF6130907.1 hypothetical protein [Flavobacterium sp. WG47]